MRLMASSRSAALADRFSSSVAAAATASAAA
jgi:hypothetical protein